jgi:simple sugar transport system permease protein
MSSIEGAVRPISPSKKRSWTARFFAKYSMQTAILGVALFIWILFLIGAPRTFLSRNIYAAFMTSTPFFALIAIPLTLVVVTGEIDLSFVSIIAWGMTGYDVVFRATQSVGLGFAACLLFGLVAGLINGIIVVKLGIPSLVTTIGTQFFWAGLVLIVTNAQGLGMAATQGTFLQVLFVGRIAGFIPAQFFWTIGFGFVFWFLLNRHRLGAHVYLIGDNIESARLMGVNVGLTKIIVFALVGVAAAFAGFVQSEELQFFWPTGGQGYLLPTLAAVFLGGTSVFGGSGTIFGTFVGCFVIGAINAGIVAAGLTGYWTSVISGFIIVVSVAIQTILSKRLT